MAAEAAGRRGIVARTKERIGGHLAALERVFGFGTRRGIANATVAVSLLCALVALLRGQDANWDLRNYHLYNPWALLEGRLGIDLAPAQMQSYFMPLLDVPYFLLVQHGPGPLAGLLLGVLHGLVFLPVAWIAWRVLERDPRRDWLAPVMALAGLASAAFLSELGTTMGNNSTAPLVLGALALALPDGAGRWPPVRLAVAGSLLGAALAFKLTNVIYAVGLGLAVLAAPVPWRSRLRAALWLTAVTSVVCLLVAGYWYYKLWSAFGNPLFPQFNAWFQAPLAQPISVGDQRWLPKGWGEALLRPLLFTANPLLVSEIALRQIVWALLYLAAAAAAFKWILLRLRGPAGGGTAVVAPARRMLSVFFVAGFCLWLAMFSIHRYLVVLEVLAPLLLWQLAHYLFPVRLAVRAGAIAIAACSLVAVAGWNGWGHAGWTWTAFRVESPPLAGTVLLVGTEPQAWRLPYLPPGAAYVSVGSNFPESPAYAAEARRIARERGAIQAMLPAPAAASDEAVRRKADANESRNRWAARLGLNRGQCSVMKWAASRSKSRHLVDSTQSASGRCRFELLPGHLEAVAVRGQQHPVAVDTGVMREAGAILGRHGFRLDPASCTVHDSWIGTEAVPYQLCRVELLRDG